MPVDTEPMGDTALLLRLGNGIDATVNAHVHALAEAIRQVDAGDIVDVVPAYASVLVRHRPLDPHARTRLHRRLADLAVESFDTTPCEHGTRHEIPVCYGGEHGRDLASLAHGHGITEQQVINLHVAPEYRVAMTGFAPGFPYLLGLDTRLATPRHKTPRTRVAAGSVGIAGTQTGVYPGELPGGWQLIGRTPLVLFNPDDADRPCLLQPGDRVRFRTIDEARFDALQATRC